MSEWWTYQFSDLLLFSSQTYYRLFELYNADIWPLQILALTLGVVILALIYWNPPWQGRMITAILAVCWLWVAFAYHLQRYATINWAATYFAAAFAIEAVLLFWTGVIRGRLIFRPATSAINMSGLGIYGFALVLQPLTAPVMGRNWNQTEIFGIAPDPTVIATLGLLLFTSNRTNWELSIIPILWCAVSAAFLWTMESPNAYVVLLAGLWIIVLLIYKTYWFRKHQQK
jgi:hypothetical protein